MYKADHLKHLILNGSFDLGLLNLYQEDRRTKALLRRNRPFCCAVWTGSRSFPFSAPGRSELSGNHTDHQHGRVLAAAVTLDIIAVVSPRSDTLVRIHSQGFQPLSLDLADLNRIEEEVGTSAALVRGIASDLTRLGYATCGFDACVTSSVPAGSDFRHRRHRTLIGAIGTTYATGLGSILCKLLKPAGLRRMFTSANLVA